MIIKRLELENFTVFNQFKMEFTKGVNIIVGENGTGKTHIMKLLYAACQSNKVDTSFPHKVVKVFRPDNLSISRLINQRSNKKESKVNIQSDLASIGLDFTNKTKKWEAIVTGEENWEAEHKHEISTYIPAKEILSNAKNFLEAYNKNNIDFDETYADIISSAKVNISNNKDIGINLNNLDKLSTLINGKVLLDNEEFYLSDNTSKLEFQLIAEGLRKIALLWQLIQNGTLQKGSILFWDEPEANISPVLIPSVVEVLLDLQQKGVQIFIATHDYILAKYFEVKRKKDHNIMFYSLYKENDDIKVSSHKYFGELKNNPIITAYDLLLDQVISKNLGN